MKNLKLNQLSKKEMDKRSMNRILGGKTCGCACAGGNNLADNYAKQGYNKANESVSVANESVSVANP